MTRHPLFRQILGAIAGSTLAAMLYVGYTSASHAVGGDLAQVATAALLGSREVARIVEPITEPAPLPELGVPLRERAVPTPPPPQADRITPETIIDAEPVQAAAAIQGPDDSIDIVEPAPAPVAAVVRAAAPAAPLAATTKAAALPNSGAADWLVLTVSAGAALGWQHRRLAALLARARVTA